MKDGGPNGTDVVVAVSGNRYVPRARERFTYDEDGNMTRDGRWAMTWDAENRLVAMETIPAAVTVGAPRQRLEFGYDSQSRRVKKRVFAWTNDDWMATSDLTFVWDGWNCVAEISQAGGTNAVSSFLWGLDLSGTFQGAGGVGGLLAITQDGATSLPYYDGNGNVMGLVDATSGVRVAIYEYGPFGETLRSTGSRASGCNWKFSSKYADPESGWAYYGHRFYSPTLGRWLNRDPIEERGGENPHSLVGNDPCGHIDHLGLLAALQDMDADAIGGGLFQRVWHWRLSDKERQFIAEQSFGGVWQQVVLSARVWSCLTGNLIYHREDTWFEVWGTAFVGNGLVTLDHNGRDIFGFRYPHAFCTRGKVRWKTHAWVFAGSVDPRASPIPGGPGGDLPVLPGEHWPKTDADLNGATYDRDVSFTWNCCRMPFEYESSP